jgi:hypothetical protein
MLALPKGFTAKSYARAEELKSAGEPDAPDDTAAGDDAGEDYGSVAPCGAVWRRGAVGSPVNRRKLPGGGAIAPPEGEVLASS